MTAVAGADEPRRTRWLPTAVTVVFLLVVLVDVVGLVLLHTGLIRRDEGPAVVMRFVPAGTADKDGVPVDPAVSTVDDSGGVLVERTARGLFLRAPGELVIRFRTADAGSTLVTDFLFGRRDPEARCTLTLGRVASRWGVDTVWRRTLNGSKQRKGKIRHYLADHVGWFELRVGINAAAAAVGFGLSDPEVLRDPPPRSAPHRLAAAPRSPRMAE